MSKYRIYELAKDFNTTSKVIIDILNRNNMEAKNHMSSVDEDAKNVITRTFAHKITSTPTAGTSTIENKPRTQEQPTQTTRSAGNDGRPQALSNSGEQRPSSNPQPQRPWQSQSNQNRPQQNQQRPPQTPFQGQRPQQNTQNQQRPPQAPFQGQRPQQNTQNQQRPPQAPFQGQRPQQNTQNQQRPPQQNFQPRNAGTQQPPVQSRPAAPPNKFQSNNNRPTNNNNAQRNQGGGNFNRRPQANRGFQSRGAAPAVKIEPPKPKSVKLGESITVKELSSKLCRDVGEVIKKLMMLGVMATINQDLDFETASLLATEFGVEVLELPPEEDPTEIAEIEDDPSSLVLRPPVVTVMGHVDHGKTSLLDSIRQTHVTSQEAGGITQHIGAYKVTCQGKKIVFLDTPGHEAFTAMRARGAQVTDIAILVVAADDGVMPQTIEAINHAKSANVPIIVAINKMDRPGANPDRIKQQLSDYGLVAEDWGGEAIMVPVSAQKKTGINELLEMILLVAEMQEIKANPNRQAYGTIIEAKLDKGRGPVATVLVQKGTLHIGDTIIAGIAYGKVRAMVNDRGEKVKKAEPSTPVEVLGLADVPQAGDVLVAVDEKIARAVAEKRIAKRRTDELMQSQKVSLDDLFKQIQDGNIQDLNIVIKADVQGSVEALRQSLLALNANNKEVRVNIVHAGVGAINESDVMLASAANALIIGFNVRPDGNARKAGESEKIDIRLYRVIYEALHDVEAAMTGMLAPEYKEVLQGRVEIRQLFTISKVVIAGAYVLEGKILNSSQVRVIRNGIVIHEGELESLRRFKDDVKEVAAGYECGITIDKFRDIKEGDIIEAFTMEEIKPKG
ncbi:MULTISPECIES: translation initiation factor IF-2 [Pelosinus]|uniref:Translation initiation factor IF-2 n=1 Tax=Pelosinus fermentans B4 TaxID=1149862 RepID=I8RG28_9FIRM|nr:MULTISPECIES: translation initiation factor IF-2 [Pelosinus]EIW18533.1 translation initiation factor IF-2 [Pelosinus fermentans B4]EIW24547.1 translation initiation factor IF-2 [Pelosinus fermentans A11]OAM94395.1 initiation factor 2 [Pelosinus fermentans DSM 17108]SDR08003.1 translation initiation factor IF-2 [Pelosinus fermentans]